MVFDCFLGAGRLVGEASLPRYGLDFLNLGINITRLKTLRELNVKVARLFAPKRIKINLVLLALLHLYSTTLKLILCGFSNGIFLGATSLQPSDLTANLTALSNDVPSMEMKVCNGGTQNFFLFWHLCGLVMCSFSICL